jgi:hypothetical protein
MMERFWCQPKKTELRREKRAANLNFGCKALEDASEG